jgi:hypothetical protein
MVKICQTGLLKSNFETRPKKTHFPVFAKNFRRPWMKFKNFFCQFPNPWALRVSGMGGYTSKCEKKSKSLHPSVHVHLYNVHAPQLFIITHFEHTVTHEFIVNPSFFLLVKYACVVLRITPICGKST